MLHFKHDALARRQAFQRRGNPLADFDSHHAALGIGRRILFLLTVEKIGGRSVPVQVDRKLRRLIFRAATAPPEMVEADVGDDAIHPGVETALEPKTGQIFVNFQEGFLVNVAGIFGSVQDIQSDSQDVAVVTMNQLLKRFAVATLRAFNQSSIIGRRQGFSSRFQSRWSPFTVEPCPGSPEPSTDHAIVIPSDDILPFSLRAQKAALKQAFRRNRTTSSPY